MTEDYERGKRDGKLEGYAEMYQYIGETLAVWASVANDETLTAEQAMQKLNEVIERFKKSKAVH